MVVPARPVLSRDVYGAYRADEWVVDFCKQPVVVRVRCSRCRAWRVISWGRSSRASTGGAGGKFLMMGLSGDRILVINPMLTGVFQYSSSTPRRRRGR